MIQQVGAIMRIDLDRYHKQVPGDYYDRALEENPLQRFWHRRRFSEAGRFLAEIEARKILDVGCHGGRFTHEILLKSGRAAVTGVDISPAAVEFARTRYPRIEFLVARAEKLPFGNNQFDLVTCFEMLEHVDEPKRVLSEIYRVLKGGDNLIVIVPIEAVLFRLIWFLWTRFGTGRVWQHVHVQKFSRSSLKSILVESGFSVVKEKAFLWGMLFLVQAQSQKV